jgi:hypothetical protein
LPPWERTVANPGSRPPEGLAIASFRPDSAAGVQAGASIGTAARGDSVPDMGRGYRVAENPPNDLTQWAVVRVNDEITVDLMTEASGISFEDAKELIDWVEIDGVRIPFANAALLLRMKQLSWREKDIMDRRFLESLKRATP